MAALTGDTLRHRLLSANSSSTYKETTIEFALPPPRLDVKLCITQLARTKRRIVCVTACFKQCSLFKASEVRSATLNITALHTLLLKYQISGPRMLPHCNRCTRSQFIQRREQLPAKRGHWAERATMLA